MERVQIPLSSKIRNPSCRLLITLSIFFAKGGISPSALTRRMGSVSESGFKYS